MKRFAKIVTLILATVIVATLAVGLVACNKDGDTTLRFSAPQGTPALAMLRLVEDNKQLGGKNMQYSVIAPANVANEMTTGNSDIVIMPVNKGAEIIRQGKDYKLVSVAVLGSLYMVGNKSGGGAISIEDIKGKKIACIGQADVPGLVFRYVLQGNGVEAITSGTPNENQVYVRYVSAGPQAITLISEGQVDFAVVGEPVATQMKANPALNCNAEMNLQTEYSRVNPSANGESFPQAGLFVRTALANDSQFMNALFDALDASKDWVEAHPSEVEAFAKEKLYEAAKFPTPSIARCAIDCERLDDSDKNEIIAFLKNVNPKDTQDTVIDWDGAKSAIFG